MHRNTVKSPHSVANNFNLNVQHNDNGMMTCSESNYRTALFEATNEILMEIPSSEPKLSTSNSCIQRKAAWTPPQSIDETQSSDNKPRQLPEVYQ